MFKAIISLASVTLFAGIQGSALANTIRIYETAQSPSQEKKSTNLTPKQIKSLKKAEKSRKRLKIDYKSIKKMPPRKFQRIAKPPKSTKTRYITTKSLPIFIKKPYYYISPEVVRIILAAQRNRTTTKEIDGMTCTYTQQTRDASNLKQNAVSLSAQNKWGGALVRARNRNGGRATSGNFSQYSLPNGMSRLPYDVGTNQSALSPEVVNPPRRTGYDRALGRIVNGHTARQVGNEVSFYMAKSNRVESVLAKAGINGSGTNWSASFTGQSESNRNKNTIMVAFVQLPFTTAVDYGPNTPAVGLLGPEATRRLPSGWQQDAAYISSIAYGKLLLMKMESTDTLAKMSAALNASYSGLTERGRVQLDANHLETLSRAKYSVWSNGGDNQSVLRTILSWSQGNPNASLNSYFEDPDESLSLYPAISYDLRYLSNGSSVSNSTIVVEDRESCRQNSTAMHLSLIYKHIETEDTTGADEMSFRTFTINGRDKNDTSENEIWNVGNRSMNDGDSVTLYQDRCVEVPNEGRNQFLDVSSTFYDRDTGYFDDDDRVWGNYRDTINLSALARTLRGTNRPFEEVVRNGGRDGARGRLKVRVSPNTDCAQ